MIWIVTVSLHYHKENVYQYVWYTNKKINQLTATFGSISGG